MCATKRGHRELYSKERYISGLADRLWKVTLVPVTTWHMPYAQYDGIYDLPEESHYLSYLLIESHMKELLLHIAQFVSIRLNSGLIERLETRPSSILHGKSNRSARDEVFLAASLVNNARKFACNPLPVTRHPLPTTRYPPPTTRYPPPVEKCCRGWPQHV